MKRNEINHHAKNLFDVTGPEVRAAHALLKPDVSLEWATKAYGHKFSGSQCRKIAEQYRSLLISSARAPIPKKRFGSSDHSAQSIR